MTLSKARWLKWPPTRGWKGHVEITWFTVCLTSFNFKLNNDYDGFIAIKLLWESKAPTGKHTNEPLIEEWLLFSYRHNLHGQDIYMSGGAVFFENKHPSVLFFNVILDMMPSQIVPSLNIMSIHDGGTRAGTAERSTSRGLSCSSLRFVQWRRSRCQHGNGLLGVCVCVFFFFQRLLEPETSIYNWLFQSDDSRSFHGKMVV